MERRVETKSSRTAEWTCICRAASSLEKNTRYKSDDTVALKILPSPIKYLIQNPFYRMIHCRFGVPKGIYEYVIARTKYMDDVYKRAISQKFDQIVILGAGFDSRAVRFPVVEGNTKVYEFDSKNTQQTKFNFFEKNNVLIPAIVQFEAIDFVKESLLERMQTIGFPKNKRCLFLMEGVSMYLEPEAIYDTFRTMVEYMGQHSLVAFDYIYSDVLQRRKRHYGETEIVKSVSKVKEAWHFGIENNQIEQFLSDYSLRLINHMSAKDMEETYFKDDQGRTIGYFNDTHCLVTAEKE
jgi:methyltransferase (TIGR00027 family)